MHSLKPLCEWCAPMNLNLNCVDLKSVSCFPELRSADPRHEEREELLQAGAQQREQSAPKASKHAGSPHKREPRRQPSRGTGKTQMEASISARHTRQAGKSSNQIISSADTDAKHLE